MRFILLAIMLTLVSCSSSSGSHYTQSIYGWRGANVNDLLKVWGTPNDKIVERGGKKLLIYQKTSFTAEQKLHSPSIGVNTSQAGHPVIVQTHDINEAWNQDLAITCTAMFLISPRGKIINSKIIGNNCYIKEDLAKQLANPKHR